MERKTIEEMARKISEEADGSWIDMITAGIDAGIESQTARIKELEDALKPFAKMFNELTPEKIKQGGILYSFDNSNLTIEDFQIASQARNKKI